MKLPQWIKNCNWTTQLAAAQTEPADVHFSADTGRKMKTSKTVCISKIIIKLAFMKITIATINPRFVEAIM